MATRSPERSPRKMLLLGAVLLLSGIFLLAPNLSPRSPYAGMYRLFGGRWPQQGLVSTLGQIDAAVRDTAAGGNLLLRLPGYDLTDPAQALHAGALYFRANYVLFPDRAYVGSRPRVINMATQLLADDEVPPPAWMAAHDVRGVRVFPGPAARR